jgi:hypothetical protein
VVSSSGRRNLVLDARSVTALALLSAVAVSIANVGGIAVGDDGVGYTAIADSILAGRGLRFFLEDPLTVWPPLWSALMALTAWVTPLSTQSAAIVLNAGVSALAVVVAWRVFRRFVRSDRLVLLGTLVVALGSSSIGFGHLLMTDRAFSVVCLLLILTLTNAWEGTNRTRWIAAAVALVWLGFGLRYVAVVLIPTGGLWLLLDNRRRFVERFTTAVAFAAASAVVPVLWILRNLAADGTLLGPRDSSARGVVQNLSDIVATLGRFVLPGVGNGRERLWAAVAVITLVGASAAIWRLLGVVADQRACSRIEVVTSTAGRPVGLLVLTPLLYLTYMLYIRSTTALNQLDLRLLEPAYLPLVAVGLATVARLRGVPPIGASPWWRVSLAGTYVWAVANVAAGLVAVVAFAAGNPFFDGNYSSDTYERARTSAALATVPDGCVDSSNLPTALYPAVESEWSPRRTGLESNDPTDDLDMLVDDLRAGNGRHCLIWVDAPPRYGHLWTREQLAERVELQQLGQDGIVTVYEFKPLR